MDRLPANKINLPVLLVAVAVVGVLVVAVLLMKSNSAGTAPSQTGTNVEQNQNTYPKMGHAPDYSWVAGQVAFTRIQGGCTYIRTVPQETAPAASAQGLEPTPGGVIVGTAERSDVSPPLRDITPITSSTSSTEETVGDSFVPGGPGWDGSKVTQGAYVVVFGHIAGPDEPREMCPGGSAYVVERMILNP